MPKNIVVSRKNAIFAVDLPITAIGDAKNVETPEGRFSEPGMSNK